MPVGKVCFRFRCNNQAPPSTNNPETDEGSGIEAVSGVVVFGVGESVGVGVGVGNGGKDEVLVHEKSLITMLRIIEVGPNVLMVKLP